MAQAEQPSAGAQGLWLVGVAQSQRGAVDVDHAAQRRGDLGMQPMGVEGDVDDAGVFEQLQGVYDQRATTDLKQGLGTLGAQGTQARAEARREHPRNGARTR